MSEEINSRIAEYRLLAGYTQTAAAYELGVKRSTYARMEKYGNPTPEMLKKIANLYNVSVSRLLYGENEKNEVSLTTDADSLKNVEMLKQDTSPFKEEIFVPTHKETQIIKMFHYLPKDKQNEVRQFIEEIYKESKNK